MIIGFAGRAGAGKTTAARIMQAKYSKDFLVEESFAKPIRAFVNELRPYTEETKAEVDPELGHSARTMMQTLGTEWGRNMIHPLLWVKALERRLAGKSAHVVLHDVRFDGEADWIRSKGGIVVLVVSDRESSIAPPHASEISLSCNRIDWTINNPYGDTGVLIGQVDALCTRWLDPGVAV